MVSSFSSRLHLNVTVTNVGSIISGNAVTNAILINAHYQARSQWSGDLLLLAVAVKAAIGTELGRRARNSANRPYASRKANIFTTIFCLAPTKYKKKRNDNL